MKKLYLIIIAITLSFGAYAQLDANYKTLGDKSFNNKDYYQAAFYYKKIAGDLKPVEKLKVPFRPDQKSSKAISSSDMTFVSYRLAESYRLYENYVEAEGWYYKVLNDNGEAQYPLTRLWYGVCLRADQHFDESIKQLQQFLAAGKGDNKQNAMAQKEIANCNFAKEQYQYPELLDVNKMKGDLNTDGSDYAIIKNDNNYMFTSSRIVKNDKRHLNRIYTLVKDGQNKPVVVNFKSDENRTELEYGTPVLNPGNNKMYMTRWYKVGSKTIHAIYYSDLQDGQWLAPQMVNSNVNLDGYNSIQPFVTPDGKRLFFVSNKPGGQGGDDIWVSDLDANGVPINSNNLGSTINTPYDEEAPYYDAVNKRLVYSSKGFIGLGGFDFFESFGDVGHWTDPRNMGYPMNSAKDDLYYYPDKDNDNKFFISSDRESECCLNLFEVYDRRHIVSGLVVDCDTHLALPGVKVSFVDSLTKQTLKQEVLGKKATYAFSVTTKRPYNLVLEKAGYFTKSVSVPVSGKMMNDTLYSPEICLQTFEVNKPILIKNILYDFNKATLRPESKVVLNNLVKILNDNPKIKIELGSHTDSIGSDAYNDKLSQERAQACVSYIIASGIKDDRIFAKGYGKRKPVAPNSLPDGKDNPDGRQMNRRTEFKVLKTE
jgi:OOP family OmpA-OmpF porin